MSDKTKKFNPPMGWIVAVNHLEVSVCRLAEEMALPPYAVAKALENSGYVLIPDQMDLAADTAKVILRQGNRAAGNPLEAVPDLEVPHE